MAVFPYQRGMADSPSSAVLVERAQAGDRAAYGRLLAAAGDRVRLYLRVRLGRRLRSVLESEDVLQETWLEAHRAFPGFRWQGEGSFVRWLCRIAERRIQGLLDHHGARKRTPPVGGGADEPSAGVPGTATSAGEREETERLVAALDALDEPERTAVLLRFFAGLSLDEVAHATASSPTSVRRLLGRALATLGDRLGGDP